MSKDSDRSMKIQPNQIKSWITKYTSYERRNIASKINVFAKNVFGCSIINSSGSDIGYCCNELPIMEKRAQATKHDEVWCNVTGSLFSSLTSSSIAIHLTQEDAPGIA